MAAALRIPLLQRCPTCGHETDKDASYAERKREERFAYLQRIVEIQRSVSLQLRVPMNKLLGHGREQPIAFARQVGMYLCRRLTGASFPLIGESFGRDHSTAIHATRLIERRGRADKAFALMLAKLEQACAT
jgi:chromosomal replication initiator protein